MNKIKILPENIANKIAAGEVVQRPESVVKELIENAIDASAGQIILNVKQAGKALIQVIDDGSGMSEEDAVLSIQKHATSKIKSYEDLEHLETFGFRGEALSSIAAVSRFEMKTKTADNDLGTLLEFDGNSELKIDKISCAEGTTITVKNLFYNTPARRNFMKSDGTELKHIIETFKKIAISNPFISFKFYNNDELIYDFIKTDKHERIKQIFGEQTYSSLFYFSENTNILSIEGYISKPKYLSKARGEQYLFINNRYLISKLVNSSVFNAFENLIEKTEYPFFILFLKLNPKDIDINVHPSKLEVKFEDDKIIWTFVNSVIKKCISKYDLVPEVMLGSGDEIGTKLDYSYNKNNQYDSSDRNPNNSYKNYNSSFTVTTHDSGAKRIQLDNIDQLFEGINSDLRKNDTPEIIQHPFAQIETQAVKKDDEYVPREKTADKNGMGVPDFLQIHNKYILCQIRSGLMVIDQHVAHERVLYEKAIKSMNTNMSFSQQLLFPFEVEVDKGDFDLIKEMNQDFMNIGFDLKFLSKNRISIIGVPQDIVDGFESQIFFTILEDYKNNIQNNSTFDKRHSIAASYSCKAAIKAGQKLTEDEMRYLVDELFATEMPYVCPHGRPIMIKISLDEFDKKFGRI